MNFSRIFTLGAAKCIIFVGLLLFASVGPVKACLVCIPYPKKTGADYLIASDSVVLAREDPERPFHFAPVAVLEGDPVEKPIDLFLDSLTRRRLVADSNLSVVLARQRGEWRRLGLATEDFETVVRQILRFAPQWRTAAPDNPRRLEFFADLLGHDNLQIHQLAFVEIGRAPYSMIKRLSGKVPKEEIYLFLHNPLYRDWHSLYILMLAQDADEQARETITAAMVSAQRFALTTNLSAWATSYIEIQQTVAISLIEDWYFRNPNRTQEELSEVMTALSVHGSEGHRHLRDRIVQSYGVLLGSHPTMAPHIAKTLISWQRWDLAEPMAGILTSRSNKDPLGNYLIRSYVSMAEGF